MEKWKVIKDFEDYEISNYGRVKSNKSKMKNTDGILKPGKSKANDKGLFYCKVILSQNGKSKTKQVHRLVAEAFIDNPEEKPQVNHLDNNGTNNLYTNLEWSTSKEDSQHQIKQGRHSMQLSNAARDERARTQKLKAKIKYDKLSGTIFGEVEAIKIWKPIGKGLRADYKCLRCGEIKLDRSFRKLYSGESITCGNCAKRKVKI